MQIGRQVEMQLAQSQRDGLVRVTGNQILAMKRIAGMRVKLRKFVVRFPELMYMKQLVELKEKLDNNGGGKMDLLLQGL